ncbi:hypothetical protein U9M48_004935 [Paspalum notatum var. saurae]|uniref:Uncharacterized protein n=1 Tax=Paspalum notatum var. saurae TaxID=547442 RepID=A0AAQ3PPP9_PASNO
MLRFKGVRPSRGLGRPAAVQARQADRPSVDTATASCGGCRRRFCKHPAQMEDKLNVSTSAMNVPAKDQENIDPNGQEIDALLTAAQLKKKEVPSSKNPSWIDKIRNGKHKATKPAAPTKKGAKQQKKKVDGHSQVEERNVEHPLVEEPNVDNDKEG